MGAMTKAKWVSVAIVASIAGLAWASGVWDEAKIKADEARRKYDEADKQFVTGEKKVVGAMCEARDVDNLKDTGRSAAGDARYDLSSKVDDFHRAVREALDKLQSIESGDPNYSDANSLTRELQNLQGRLDDKTRSMVNGDPEIIDQVVRTAESARNDHRDRCAQRDFYADGERIGCLIKDSDTCYVLEIALDNNGSPSSARDRARRGAEHVQSELKKSSPAREVNGCVHVEARVDCLKVCPEVSDEGRVSDPRASWRERCEY